MSGIRICFYSPASRGGAGWFVSALAQAMADAGAHVEFIAPEMVPASREPGGPNISRHKLIAGTAGKGGLPVRIARTAWRIAATFPILAAARFRTREYLVTMFDWIPVLVLQLLFLKLMGGRITFVVHDVTPHAWAFPLRLRSIERWLYGLSYRLPDRIVTLTESARAELASDWGRTRDSHVIRHGAYTHGEPEPLPGEGRVLVFGMLRRNKRILESIEAMRIMASGGTTLRMTIAGEPHVDDLPYWHACEMALVGLEDYVSVEAGFVPEDRVRELVAMSDALLLPYEQFNSQSGVAILGAMGERIVVATNAGGMAELIDLGMEAIPVGTPVDAVKIVDALRALEQMALGERRASAERSRQALVSQLSWDKIGEAYVAMFKGAARSARVRTERAPTDRN